MFPHPGWKLRMRRRGSTRAALSTYHDRMPTVAHTKLGWLLVGLWWTVLGAEPDAETAWKFVVTGDSRGSRQQEVLGPVFREIVVAVAAERPALVFFTGDLAIGPGARVKFDAWTNALARVYTAGIPVYPVRGNHDLGDDAGWRAVFGSVIPSNGPPGQQGFTFALTHRNALFIGLDTYSPLPLKWLEAIVATNRLPHVFAFGHQPAFQTDHMDALDMDVPARDAFWKALKKAGGRAYFCGHDHFYHHTRLDDGDGNPDNDLHQIILGTAGAPLRDRWRYAGENSLWTPVCVRHESQYGYMVVEIHGPKATFTWKHRAAPASYVPAESFFYVIPGNEAE